MRCLSFLVAVAVLNLSASAGAANFRFDAAPFALSDALTTPGRQIVPNERFLSFNPAADVFAFDQNAFGLGGPLVVANDVAANLPTGGANVIVLRDFDNDNNAGTPFVAGTAADLIAARVTAPGPGFFIYFNSGLNVPRLVFSTDLNDNTADLKIIARMTNLTGQTGRDAFPTFSAANFAFVPEPSGMVLVAASCAVGVLCYRWRRLTPRPK
jgi:hypothetical protein